MPPAGVEIAGWGGEDGSDLLGLVDKARTAPRGGPGGRGDPGAQNDVAWLLATCPDPRFRDPDLAVELAGVAIRLVTGDASYWNTLGVARYRAGDWEGAIRALEGSMRLQKGGDSNDWFVLAMAHWQLSDPGQARTWYRRAVAWMDKHQPQNKEL